VFIPFTAHDPAGDRHVALGPWHVSGAHLLLFWNLLIKSYLAVLTLILLCSTTPYNALLQGMEHLGAPRLLTMLAGLAYRYQFVLLDEVLRMKRARDARGYRGQWLWQAQVVGQMIGTLFVRSYERAERVYLAMVARGFDGAAVGQGRMVLRMTDYVFMAVSGGVLLALRLLS
jgi:cobalt/nickel transport system permease protein